MDLSIISMFKDIKRETFTNVNDYKSKSDRESVVAWFSQHKLSKNKNIDVIMIINLMYGLYICESIDFYPIDGYRQVNIVPTEKYYFNINKFFEMLQSLRALVYGISL